MQMSVPLQLAGLVILSSQGAHLRVHHQLAAGILTNVQQILAFPDLTDHRNAVVISYLQPSKLELEERHAARST